MDLDLEQLRQTPLCRDPFDYVIVDNFLCADRVAELAGDFPAVPGHGSYPIETLACGRAFSGLAAELTAAPLRHAIEEKFGLDLSDRPTMITLRGFSDGKDGRIHTDSATKLITLLLYMNPAWDEAVGRLRLLRGPDDLADCVIEV
ncbi:MAG: 2OG-Fe(II) oxygenase, partial [Stellaceae bacterium]